MELLAAFVLFFLFPLAHADQAVFLYDWQSFGVTSNSSSGTRNPLDIETIVSGSIVDPRSIRALTSSDVVSCVQSTAGSAANGWFVKWTDGTSTAAVKAASTAAATTDPSGVVQLSPNGNQATAGNQTTEITALGTINTTLGTTLPRNVSQIGGNSVNTGTGTAGTGTQRVILATDQPGINSFLDKSGTGTISALNGTVTLTPNGMSTLDLSAQGTFSATLQVQGQAGDNAWTAVLGYVPGSGNTATVLTGASNLIFPIGGFSQVRIIAIAYTSGTANIQYNLSAGAQGSQVFNLVPASFQATMTGSGSAGTPASGVISIQGVASGTVVPGNVTQLGGNTINTGAGATSTGTQRVASNAYDGSGNAETSTTITGTAANKQPQDINPLSTGTAKYFTSFSTQQTAATAANAAIFTMRNAAAATKTVILENISCRQGFNAASPVTRTQEGYLFQRFSAATPTGGTALTAGQGDSSDAASQVTDIRFLDTGLTTTGVTFVANSLAEMLCDTTQGIECSEPILNSPSGWKLAPGEGLVIRLTTATVVGVTIGCHFGWREQ